MYIQNLRDRLKVLRDKGLLGDLAREMFYYKKEIGQTGMKISEITSSLENFCEKGNMGLENVDACLMMLDKIYIDGAIKALKGEKTDSEPTWKDILISLTKDREINKKIGQHLVDNEVTLELERAVFHLINYCSSDDKETFKNNLQAIKKFLIIKNRKN